MKPYRRQALRDQWAEAIHRFVYGSYYRLSCSTRTHIRATTCSTRTGASASWTSAASSAPRRAGSRCSSRSTANACAATCRGRGERASRPECGAPPILSAPRRCSPTGERTIPWSGREAVRRDPGERRQRHRAQVLTGGPSANALRHCTMPADYALLARAEIGAMSVIAQLRAGNDWRSFAAEYREDAAPLTAMGRSERSFLEQRERHVTY